MTTPRKASTTRSGSPAKRAAATAPATPAARARAESKAVREARESLSEGLEFDADGAPVALVQGPKWVPELALVFTSNPDDPALRREWHAITNLSVSRALATKSAIEAVFANTVESPLRALLEHVVYEDDAVEEILDSGDVELSNSDYLTLTKILLSHMNRPSADSGN